MANRASAVLPLTTDRPSCEQLPCRGLRGDSVLILVVKANSGAKT